MNIKCEFVKDGEDLQKILEMFLVDFYYEYYELESVRNIQK